MSDRDNGPARPRAAVRHARRPVVAAVDGSHASIRAARLAAGEARRRGAPLQLLHTWLDVAGRLGAQADVLLTTLTRSLASAEVSVSSAIEPGSTVDSLRAVSAEAQLLVLGHRDGNGHRGTFGASTAQAVAASARCPVVVVPDDRTSILVRGRRSVVVGVEGASDADDVLSFALDAAASRGTDVLAVHAWRAVPRAADHDDGAFVDWTAVRAREEHVLSQALGGWRERYPDVPIREVVVRERTPAVLLSAALTADLLVIGHRRRGPLATRRSTTHAVLHRATGPVAVVPLAPEAGR